MENSNVNPVEDTAKSRASVPGHEYDRATDAYYPLIPQEAPLTPVTETEMHDFQQGAASFFNRIVSTVVSMSDQAIELGKLRQEVSTATAKLQELIDDNSRKAEELSALRESNSWLSNTARENGERAIKAETAAREATEWAKTLEEDHATVVAKLTSTIEQDKQDAAENAQRYQDTLNSVNGRNSELTQRVRDLEADNANLQRDNSVAMGASEEWKHRFETIQAERDTLRGKLDTLRQAFAS